MKQRRTGFPFSQEPLERGSSEFRLPRCSLTQQSCHIAGVPSLGRICGLGRGTPEAVRAKLSTD